MTAHVKYIKLIRRGLKYCHIVKWLNGNSKLLLFPGSYDEQKLDFHSHKQYRLF